MTDCARHAIDVPPARSPYVLIALCCIGFALYVSLIPLDLQPSSWSGAWARFRSAMNTWPRRVSRTDIVANTLLFVPIGFALCGALLTHTRRASFALAVPLVVAVGVSVSLLAEFLQTFATHRVPSALDVVAQTAGTCAGIVLWATIGTALTDWIRAARSAAPDDRLSRLLSATVVAWVVVNLAPFTITVDLGDLADRVQSGQIALAPRAWRDWGPRENWDALAELFSAVPIGLWAYMSTRRRVGGQWSAAVALSALIIAGVEVAQVFVESHAALLSDVIFSVAGAAASIVIAPRVVPSLRPSPASEDPTAAPYAWALSGAVVVVLLLNCAWHWQPYDFSTEPTLIQRKLGGISLIPFAMSAAGSYLNALTSVLTDLALSVPLGFFGMALLEQWRVPRKLSGVLLLVSAAGVFAAIEAGQLLLPTRTPDPTDVLIGGLGVYFGGRLVEWAAAARQS